jgi:hypothetical protein
MRKLYPPSRLGFWPSILPHMSDFAQEFAPRPRRPSPARAERRRLAVDLGLGAILAGLVLLLAGGLGVVAWFGVPVLIIVLLSFAVEWLIRRRRARRALRPRSRV